jgi:hypothetical protein
MIGSDAATTRARLVRRFGTPPAIYVWGALVPIGFRWLEALRSEHRVLFLLAVAPVLLLRAGEAETLAKAQLVEMPVPVEIATLETGRVYLVSRD